MKFLDIVPDSILKQITNNKLQIKDNEYFAFVAKIKMRHTMYTIWRSTMLILSRYPSKTKYFNIDA